MAYADWRYYETPLSFPDGYTLEPASFEDLEAWHGDNHIQALKAYKRSCLLLPEEIWGNSCRAARAIKSAGYNDKAAQRFFEDYFQPHFIMSPSQTTSLFTGYYEPILNGSYSQGGTYQTPLLRRPPDLNTRVWPARTIIEEAIAAQAPEVRDLAFVWVDDPVAAFFLHIQGSGRVRLEGGEEIRVAFEGKTGRPYTPIGRVLVARGALEKEKVSMQSIRAWLKAHPDKAASVMAENEAYIFFRPEALKPDDTGPVGAAGVPLIPERSLAVDQSVFSLGVPLWVETQVSVPGGGQHLWRRLMVAQDTGSAIRGVVRGDIFFGFGDEAAFRAGKMSAPGRLAILLPVQ